VEDAWQASNGLRVSINEARNRQPEQVITVADLVDHYTETELAFDLGNEGKSHAAKVVYKEFLGRWVRPTWGIFNHAIRYEWLEQGRNPILFVRQSAKRQRIPECLEPEELRAISQLDRRFRVMVLLDAASRLRRSELLALKWSDVDFDELQINVRRSIYLNVISNCKTEASRKPAHGPNPCLRALVLETRQPLQTV
jgi:integrase